jgi:hypothetical protein
MATANTHPRLSFRADDLFFSAMAAVALAVVLIGFARTYFLAGLFWAPLPNLLVRCWMRASTAGRCSTPTRSGSCT